ncbi:LysR family transcriptional regulator [Paenibacillus beijingensis]|uniref:LysR family transcriptional regulator n=1 Tax=Paenibacillus beijingensis TaxID=1126833 RepID=A0A0D5NJF1_9BACL|nr:LysR family transcriptional regulator [Paenibacillus beijingensis]AJY75063.1 LysR family transcriptional regulator [Paenibacillus beijingensis]
MEEKDWLILKTVYQKKNITKAAEQLYISQPALTYRIQQLEKEFGAKIVSRGKTGVEFTPQGECLVNYAEQMLHELRKTKERILNMNDQVVGTLRLGVSGSYARYYLPTLLKSFVSQHNGVEINVRTGWSSQVLSHVQKEEVHIGILRGSHSWSEQSLPLTREPLCLIAKEPIDLNALPSLPKINYVINDPRLRQDIEKWWLERFSSPPLITMEVDSIETCVELVSNGLGYGIVPSISLQNHKSLFVQNLQTKDGGQIIRETLLVYRNTSLELSVVKAFVDFIKSNLENAVG